MVHNVARPLPAPAAHLPEPDPVILAAFRAAGVTAEDVTVFASVRPRFAPYAPLLEPAP